jgi:hypothetical protein
MGDRPPAVKIEEVAEGWNVSFFRPGQPYKFRVKKYLDPNHAEAVAERYVQFCKFLLAQKSR